MEFILQDSILSYFLFLGGKKLRKTARVNLKVSQKFKNELVSEAVHLGFKKGKGTVNFSRFCRWILREGNKPIDRSQYAELVKININLMKLGGLFNQNQFHSNRELRILNERGFSGKSNKGVIKRLEHNIELSELLKKEIYEMKKIMMKIVIIENA